MCVSSFFFHYMQIYVNISQRNCGMEKYQVDYKFVLYKNGMITDL